MLKNKILCFSLLFFSILTFCSREIPFFWSGTFFSEQAVSFFSLGFNDFISPVEVDTGGFPLYSVYLALVWNFFGKTLLVSHLAFLPVFLGIVNEYYKLASKFLNKQLLYFSLILLLLEPTFITQSVLIAYDLLLVYFFFLALNALLENKKWLFLLASIFLCLSNMRGVMMLFALCIIDLILKHQKGEKVRAISLLHYLPSLFFVFFWAVYHHSQTGWYFFSPTRSDNHESFVSFNMMFRQAFYILWKIIDFGRIGLCLFIFVGSIIIFRKQQKDEVLKQLLVLIIIPVIVLIAFMSPLANPIGHRYFMVTFLLLNIGASYMLKNVIDNGKRFFLFISFCVLLITGNFWLYPQRFGNGWDSSLKVLPYFSLQKQVDQFIVENKIDPSEIASQFPFVADTRFSYLLEQSQQYINVDKGPLNGYKYFLSSNLINSHLLKEIDVIEKDWTLLKEFRSGQIYIALYRNDIQKTIN